MPRYYTLAGPERDKPLIPVVAEDVGPYSSLDEALADWPGFHPATPMEYDAYARYWRLHWMVVDEFTKVED